MATIEAKFTLGTQTDGGSSGVLDDFLAGTGNLKTMGTLLYTTFLLYGMNFEVLRGKNFTVTGLTLKITGGRYNNTSSASNTSITYGFRSNGNETEIGKSSYTMLTGSIAPTTVHTINASQQCAELLPWINANKTAFLDNSFSNSFCVYFGLRYAQIKAATVILEYQFEKSKITVVAGEGGTVTGGGEHEDGDTATLTATPSTGYKFKQWSDGNTANPRTVTVAGNATYTAQFEKLTYNISATVSPAEGGTVSGAGVYSHGDTATLTATPATGFQFVQWSDGVTNPTRTQTVTAAASFTAIFEKVATSNVFAGTNRQTAYRGTAKQAVYIGNKKI